MPLYALATCKIEKKTKFEDIRNNSKSNQQAFADNKEMLTKAVILNFPDPQAPLALTCDTSLVALGATLEQHVDRCWRPLGIWSKSLRPYKQKLTSFCRETLAVQQAFRHFKHDIAGRHIVVFSDCKALVPHIPGLRPLAKAHLVEIGQWTRDVRHIEAKDNQMADYLST